MKYTYVTLDKEYSWFHSFTQAMIIFEDGNSWEFIHNFPSAGPVTIEKLLQGWGETTTSRNLNAFVQYIMRWRNRRKWGILKNKHFFDCFVIPNTRKKAFLADSSLRNEWWIDRF